MTISSSELEKRANQYAQFCGIEIVSRLGFGNDGAVFETDRETAVKVVERMRNYEHELQSYQRLKEKQATSIHGFSIPQLINHHDALMVIEMSIVTAPYLIDFGKVYIDVCPDPHLFRDFEAEGQETFGKRWKDVKCLLAALRMHGIYYLDPKPGNISFAGNANDNLDESGL